MVRETQSRFFLNGVGDRSTKGFGGHLRDRVVDGFDKVNIVSLYTIMYFERARHRDRKRERRVKLRAQFRCDDQFYT